VTDMSRFSTAFHWASETGLSMAALLDDVPAIFRIGRRAELRLLRSNARLMDS
jgi:hypothetical protein